MQFYIDPGTGSMLFTILVGLLGAGVFAFRNLILKMRFFMGGGAKETANKGRIPIAIFTDSKRYWNIFGPICRELDKRGQEAVYITASEDDPAFNEKFEHIKCEFAGEGNRAYAKMNLLKADIVLSSTPGLDVYQWKRSRDVKYYVHIPHMVSDITTYRMFGLDYYDAVLLSGEYMRHQVSALEKLRGLPEKEMTVVGMPYMDELKKRNENEAAPDKNGITVLLAPSWGPSSILNRYGSRIFDSLLKTGYHIIVRPHPQSYVSEIELIEKLKQEYPDSERIEWNSDNDNFEVLRKSDILISDFSGVMFDFALVFGRPVIYADTSFDKSPYDAWWLDEEMWTFEVLPRIGQQLTEENLDSIKDLIDSCLNDSRYSEGIAEAKEEAWSCIGHSAEKTADYLIGKLAEIRSADTEEKEEK